MAERRRRTHPELTEDALRATAASSHVAYLTAAATHPDTPDDALGAIVVTEKWIHEQGQAVFDRHTVPHSHWQATLSVAERKRIPRTVADALVRHWEPEVRQTALRNRAVGATTLRHWSVDGANSFERMAAAENPNCPADLLTRLADDTSPGVRMQVAKHRRTPADVLERLADDTEDIVLQAVLGNPRTPEHILSDLALRL